jgi:hypothetical protein
VAVARGFGVRCAEPVVLHDGSNVLVHLRPAPVVARVASLTALVRPGVEAWLRRDIEMSAYLAGCGVGVVPPCADPPAGPHHRDGLVVAFFAHVPHDAGFAPEPVAVGRLLGELHAALRAYPGALPGDGPVADLRRAFDLLEREGVLPLARLDGLRAELGVLAAAIEGLPGQALHGDAHPGNLLATPNGLVWNDFEDTWRGPVAWDLACLLCSTRVGARAAVAAYPELPDAGEIALFVRLRRLQSVCWPVFVDWVRRVHGLGTTAY